VTARKIPLSNDIRVDTVEYRNTLKRKDLSAMGAINVERRRAPFWRISAAGRGSSGSERPLARRLVNRGDLVQAPTASRTTPLFTVQRIDTIRVFCDVPENDVPHLHIGDPAIVKPSGFDGKPFIGKVTRFSLRIDPETRNMRTEIDLPNPDERLYPGMYAEVSLEMNRRPDALTVPAAAVGSDGDCNFVDTVTHNRITRLAIKTGLTDNGRIEVTAGLSEETPVVATIQSAPPPRTAVRPPMACSSG
jgi:RND family efflux transporter MFP subunit